MQDEEQTLEEFRREIKNLSQLHHPNIVLFIGACLDPVFCIIVEYIRKGSLADVIQRHNKVHGHEGEHLIDNESKNLDADDKDLRLTADRRLKIAVGAARGMAYLHSHQVIHRYARLTAPTISQHGALIQRVAPKHTHTHTHSDLKSPNILVTADWDGKITDFGGSRPIHQPSKTMTFTYFGTTRYVSTHSSTRLPDTH